MSFAAGGLVVEGGVRRNWQGSGGPRGGREASLFVSGGVSPEIFVSLLFGRVTSNNSKCSMNAVDARTMLLFDLILFGQGSSSGLFHASSLDYGSYGCWSCTRRSLPLSSLHPVSNEAADRNAQDVARKMEQDNARLREAVDSLEKAASEDKTGPRRTRDGLLPGVGVTGGLDNAAASAAFPTGASGARLETVAVGVDGGSDNGAHTAVLEREKGQLVEVCERGQMSVSKCSPIHIADVIVNLLRVINPRSCLSARRWFFPECLSVARWSRRCPRLELYRFVSLPE